MDISEIGKIQMESELRDLQERMEEISIRLNNARGEGDLSENAEYDEASAEMRTTQTRIQELESVLSTAKVKHGYSSTISSGSLITFKLVDDQDNVIKDYGLRMFEDVGDLMFNGKLNPTSPLGKRIKGTTGGRFTILDNSGNQLHYVVTLEAESRLPEFISLFGRSKDEILKEMYKA